MKNCVIVALAAVCSIALNHSAFAQSDAPYTEGPVWQVTMVKVKPGLEDDYLKGLIKTFKGTLEEAKQQHLVISYKVLIGDAATPQDYNILLMVESPNMASFDNAREKFDPIAKKIEGSLDEQRSVMVKRLDVREIMGVKTMREVTLK